MILLKEIVKYTNGELINGDSCAQVNEFCLLKQTPKLKDYFFIPITFQGTNRENYILNHVKNGCLGFMISNSFESKNKIEEDAMKINPNICIIEVDSVNNALYILGKIYRDKNINKPVIAVTGSVGKTTLCNLISKILSTEIKVLYDFKSQNNNTKSHISLSYLYFDDYDMAVTEIGVSNFGHMSKISELVKPSIAVINSIGTAHINNFKTKENILNEKMHIVDHNKDERLLYVNVDDEYLRKVEKSDNYKLLGYSLNEAWNIKESSEGINFTTKIYDKETNFSLNLYGDFIIRNIILAIKIAEIYHIKYENIVNAINKFRTIDGRFKVLKNIENKIIVIDDTYNSCYESVINGLEISNKIQSNRKIAVLGTIGSGSNGKEDTSLVHEYVGEYFKNLNYDYLYLIGDYTKHIFKKAIPYFSHQNIKRFKNKELLLEELINTINNGDLIYIKDAGLQEFEKVVYQLQNKYNLN